MTCETQTMPRSQSVLWLQGITVIWMVIECGASLRAAAMAHSPALLAFGSDSMVEFVSATVLLLHFSRNARISEKQAARAAAILLFALAAFVTLIALLSLTGRTKPQQSSAGIGLMILALLIMPALGWLKRREARRLHSSALAADAVQSATCAYLAGITLIGLALNAVFHVEWFDSVAALMAVPILLREGSNALKEQLCRC